MALLAPLIFAFLFGALVLLPAILKSRLPHRFLFLLATAGPAGLGIISVLVFFSYLISPTQSRVILFGFLYLLGAISLVKSLRLLTGAEFSRLRFSKQPLTWAAFLLFAFIAYHFCKLFWGVSLVNVFGGWDTRYFWSLKAKFYLRDPMQWKSMFSPLLAWAHPDYPLMLPGSIFWGWSWLGKEANLWSAVVAFVFMVSFAFLIAWTLLAAGRKLWVAFTASAFFLTLNAFSFWGVSQYADVPLAYFMTAAGVLLVFSVRNQDKAALFLCGLMTGLALWTKNEGMFFTMWISLLVGWKMLWPRRFERPQLLRHGLAYGLGLLPAFLSTFIMKIFLGTTSDYLGTERTLGQTFSMVFGDPGKTKTILQNFYLLMVNFENWNGMWIFFAVALAFFAWKRKELRDFGLLAGLVGLINLGYLYIMHVTPHDTMWQINTALTRLLVHSGGLAFLFAFYTFSICHSEQSEESASRLTADPSLRSG